MLVGDEACEVVGEIVGDLVGTVDGEFGIAFVGATVVDEACEVVGEVVSDFVGPLVVNELVDGAVVCEVIGDEVGAPTWEFVGDAVVVVGESGGGTVVAPPVGASVLPGRSVGSSVGELAARLRNAPSKPFRNSSLSIAAFSRFNNSLVPSDCPVLLLFVWRGTLLHMTLGSLALYK